MLVAIVVLIASCLTASALHRINNLLVLVLVDQVLIVALIVTLIVWLLVDQLSAVAIALEEAAMLDGLSRFGVFPRISLPLARPGIAVAPSCRASSPATTCSTPSS